MKLAGIARTSSLAAIGVFAAFAASAAVRNVDYVSGVDATDSQVWKTLAFAVANADEGDEIVLLPGRHPMTAKSLAIDRAMTIHGTGAPEDTSIDGRYSSDYQFVLSVDGVIFHSLSLTNFYSSTKPAVDVSAAVAFSNVVFADTGSYGGGLLTMTKGVVSGCRFLNAKAQYRQIVSLVGAATLENSYFAGCTCWGGSSPGCIVSIGDSKATLRNCTIVDSKVKTYGAVNGAAAGHVYNNAIWGNYDGDTQGVANWSGTVSGFRGNCTTPVAGLPVDGGNIASDPQLFEDRLHFKYASPCRGTALADCATAFDLEGRARGATPSIGAVEYVDFGIMEVSFVASAEFVRQAAGITLTPTVRGGTAPCTYAWDFNGDGLIDSTEECPTISDVGVYRPTLTVTDAASQQESAEADGILCIHAAGAATYHVDNAAGSDDNDGLTEGTAWKTLLYALAQPLVVDGDVLQLARGLHPVSSVVSVGKAVTVCGAGACDETSVNGLYNQDYRLVLSATGATLRNLSLTNFYAGTKPSVEVSANVTFSNVTFASCGFYGGGLLEMTEGLVTCCRFLGDSGRYNQIVKLIGAATLENSYFAGCTCWGGSSPGCIVSISDSKATLKNCTIVDSKVKTYGAVNGAAAGHVYNNIIWDNIDGDTQGVANWSGTVSGFRGNCTAPVAGLPADGGNIASDPQLFEDRLHFKYASPCRGTALADYATAVDLEGRARGATPSIGAVEYVNMGQMEVSFDASAEFVRQPKTILLTPTVQGGTAPYAYAWDFNGDGLIDSTEECPTISDVGVYHPTLTVTDAASQQESAVAGGNLYVHSAGAAIYHVDNATGSDADDGLTPETAWRTLAFAVTSPLVVDGDAIVLAKGTHPISSTVTIGKAIAVRGAGLPEETSLNGFWKDENPPQAYRVVLGADGASLSSLSVTNFYGNGERGSVAMTHAGLVSNVLVSSCFTYGTPTLEAAAGLVTHCRVISTAGGYRGIVRLQGTATMVNSLVANCNCGAVEPGEIVWIDGEDVTFRNCTVVDNVASAKFGAVLDWSAGSRTSATVANNIVWDNADRSSGIAIGAVVSNVLSSTKWTSNCLEVAVGVMGAGNIRTNPRFEERRPYHLSSESPCRNTGDNALVAEGETDLDGCPRRNGRRVDMGCYECGPTGFRVLVR